MTVIAGASTRDRLSLRSKEFDAQYPEALDLEADCLDAMRPELSGVMALLRGTRNEVAFREVLRGDRAPGLTLREICRLRLSDREEAQRATDAMLAVLLNAGQNGTAAVTFEGIAALLEGTTGVIAGLTRDLEDGVISREEASKRLPDARRLSARLSVLITALEVAERMPERAR